MIRDEPRPEALRNEIARTRAEMSRTLGELRRKVIPDERYQEMIRTGRSLVEGAGRSLKTNPVPVMLAGAGIAWFVAQGIFESARVRACGCAPGAECPHGESAVERTEEVSRSIGERMKSGAHALGDRMKSSAHDLGDRVTERARSMGRRARDTASEVGQKAVGFYEENPLVAGAIALAAGLAAALAVPPTRFEKDLLGAKGADLLDRGQEIGRKVAEAAREKAVEEVSSTTTASEGGPSEPSDNT
ncbi:MAG TPA: DUF3618 domain-containing protein [Planctomycetota bacterium]|nr:DUF3618 domain-containing protein [Planctomycetota bacterium]